MVRALLWTPLQELTALSRTR